MRSLTALIVIFLLDYTVFAIHTLVACIAFVIFWSSKCMASTLLVWKVNVTALMTMQCPVHESSFSMFTWNFNCSCSVISKFALSPFAFCTNISISIVLPNYLVSIENKVYSYLWTFRCISKTVDQVLCYFLNKHILLFLKFVKTIREAHQNFSKTIRLAQKWIKSTSHILGFVRQGPLWLSRCWSVFKSERLANRWKAANFKPTIVTNPFNMLKKCWGLTILATVPKKTWFITEEHWSGSLYIANHAR